jgi:hypothetical protein
MLTSISLWYGSIRVDKLLDATSGELFKIDTTSGHVLHEAWLSELDFERLQQVERQMQELAA